MSRIFGKEAIETTALALIAQSMSLIGAPYAIVGNRVFSMSAIDLAEELEDGGLRVALRGGEEFDMTLEEKKEFIKTVTEGIAYARKLQAQNQFGITSGLGVNVKPV